MFVPTISSFVPGQRYSDSYLILCDSALSSERGNQMSHTDVFHCNVRLPQQGYTLLFLDVAFLLVRELFNFSAILKTIDIHAS